MDVGKEVDIGVTISVEAGVGAAVDVEVGVGVKAETGMSAAVCVSVGTTVTMRVVGSGPQADSKRNVTVQGGIPHICGGEAARNRHRRGLLPAPVA